MIVWTKPYVDVGLKFVVNLLIPSNCVEQLITDNITDFIIHSNPACLQNVSCLGLCDRDICPENL